MKRLWSKDYNELHKDKGNWSVESRNNKYAFTMRDGSIKRMSYFFELYKPKSLLDYGCGHGTNHFRIPENIKLINYDPFVEQWSAKPNQSADLTVCYNVFNTIECEYFDDVVDDIFNLTNKALVCNIRVPGEWRNDPEYFVKKLSSRFSIKDCSYTENQSYGNKNLFLLLEK